MADLIMRRRGTILICVFAFALLFILLSSGKNRTILNYIPTLDTFSGGPFEPRNIFFDLGANIGDSAQMFVDSNFTSDHPLKGFGAKDGKRWVIYSFEANPVHNENLDKAQTFVQALGHTQYVYKQTAAWINNKNMTFYLDTVNKAQNFWGASLHKEHGDALRSNYKNVEVRSVDISELLKTFSSEDFIVLKIDIEGSEFPMLDHLIKEGSIHLVDIITIEFHNIFKNATVSFGDLVNYYQTFFKVYDIKYIPWYLGHGPFTS